MTRALCDHTVNTGITESRSLFSGGQLVRNSWGGGMSSLGIKLSTHPALQVFYHCVGREHPVQSPPLWMSCRIQSYLGLDRLSYIFLSAETSRALDLPWESIWIWRGGGARWCNGRVLLFPNPGICGPGQPGAWSWGCNPVLACGAYSVCSFFSRQLLGLVSCPSFLLESFIVHLHTSSGAVAWLDTQMEITQVHGVVCAFASHVTSVSHVTFLCKMGLTCRMWEYQMTSLKTFMYFAGSWCLLTWALCNCKLKFFS